MSISDKIDNLNKLMKNYSNEDSMYQMLNEEKEKLEKQSYDNLSDNFKKILDIIKERDTKKYCLKRDWIKKAFENCANPMSPDEFTELLKVLDTLHGDDYEGSHIEMDEVLCRLLNSLGYSRGITVYENSGKWYA